ncbi:hypothetical protein [Cohnella algarum]|uniref:hypothetical protein n=1 Tax=Cohnella algarum TaxID=2044859 RepID=UPI001967D2F4|nr:hypothetical protein [Cohnella algarum]MBN2983568.1 hypothetical protein [Cohnella algarum]
MSNQGSRNWGNRCLEWILSNEELGILVEKAEKAPPDWTKSNEDDVFCEKAGFDWMKSNQALPNSVPSRATSQNLRNLRNPRKLRIPRNPKNPQKPAKNRKKPQKPAKIRKNPQKTAKTRKNLQKPASPSFIPPGSLPSACMLPPLALSR